MKKLLALAMMCFSMSAMAQIEGEVEEVVEDTKTCTEWQKQFTEEIVALKGQVAKIAASLKTSKGDKSLKSELQTLKSDLKYAQNNLKVAKKAVSAEQKAEKELQKAMKQSTKLQQLSTKAENAVIKAQRKAAAAEKKVTAAEQKVSKAQQKVEAARNVAEKAHTQVENARAKVGELANEVDINETAVAKAQEQKAAAKLIIRNGVSVRADGKSGKR